ncbi:hypothetical protein DFJ74DRAFT_713872 [Hyaloraphidium curvatum]|nr:hypothetical protein DFJ74DRAFT_713872 [Hyaloraphidium curvatum]
MELVLRGVAPHVAAEDPDASVPRGLRRIAAVTVQHALSLLALPVGAALWPPYLFLRLFLPRPPVVPPLSRFRHIARLIWTTRVPPPGLRPLDRWRLLLALGVDLVLAPMAGLAWMLDELLFGAELAANPVVAPLYEISAWRSGSTTLAHVLANDSGLAAPNVLQNLMPYLWLWRLAAWLLGPRIDRTWLSASVRSVVPPAFAERHEIDLFRPDTYDVLYYRHQLVPYALMLGPEAAAAEFSHRGATPSTVGMWDDFARMVDGLGRRTLAFAGPGPGPAGRRRFFLKGHFLAAAPALAAKYPGAAFLAVLRDPVRRMRSTLNYLRLSPDFFGLGPMVWPWIAGMAWTEAEYSRREMEWFSLRDGTTKCAVPFDLVAKDLPAALDMIYASCFGSEVPREVPRTHPRHFTGSYRLDHTLEDLGIDEDELGRKLEGYSRWCRTGTADRRPYE